MKDFLIRKSEHVPKLLYCLAAAVVVLLGSKGLAFRNSIDSPVDAPGQAQTKIDDLIKPYKESAEKLKKNDIFMPPPPEQKHEPPVCQGIVGSTVLIGDKFYKKGDNAEGAEILEVGPSTVTVKWRDKEIELAPFLAKEQPGEQNQPQPGPSRDRRSPSRPDVQNAPDEQRQEPERQQRRAPGMRPGGNAESIRSQWMQMSAEQRDQMRQRWERMSPEEREEMRNRMRSGRGGFRPN